MRRDARPSRIGDGLVDGRRTPLQATLRLVEAVLEDGMRSVLRLSRSVDARGTRLWRDDVRWLTSQDRSEPFAFESLCEVLDIDAGRLRRKALMEVERLRHLTIRRRPRRV